MKDTVIVFARAPRLGGVKRRLARLVGDRAALRFHVATLTALLRSLHRCRRFNLVLALTPDRARFRLPPPFGPSCGAGLAVPAGRLICVPQGGGDLGQRMARALRRYRRVALIGSDIPDARASDVVAAFRALGNADAVFGPAADGGYWLIALGSRRPSDLFGATRWSSEHALDDTLRQFRRHRVGFIRVLEDVDTEDAYRRFLASRQ